MNLREEFEKETGGEVIVKCFDDNMFYDMYYVDWLENKINKTQERISSIVTEMKEIPQDIAEIINQNFMKML